MSLATRLKYALGYGLGCAVGFVFRKQIRAERAMAKEARRKLNRSYPSSGKVAILLYGEQRQYDLLFAENSPCGKRKTHIEAVNYRTEVMPNWEHAEHWSVLRFLQHYKATALRRLPFGLVYSFEGGPKPFYFHGPYSKRRRDEGVALSEAVAAFVEEIDRQVVLGKA